MFIRQTFFSVGYPPKLSRSNPKVYAIHVFLISLYSKLLKQTAELILLTSTFNSPVSVPELQLPLTHHTSSPNSSSTHNPCSCLSGKHRLPPTGEKSTSRNHKTQGCILRPLRWKKENVRLNLRSSSKVLIRKWPLEKWYSPGWYTSVDWAQACKAKGHQFDSQSGHLPGLWAKYPVGGAQEATTHWCFPLFLLPFPSL